MTSALRNPAISTVAERIADVKAYFSDAVNVLCQGAPVVSAQGGAAERVTPFCAVSYHLWLAVGFAPSFVGVFACARHDNERGVLSCAL